MIMAEGRMESSVNTIRRIDFIKSTAHAAAFHLWHSSKFSSSYASKEQVRPGSDPPCDQMDGSCQ
jgi:hypothetical protein